VPTFTSTLLQVLGKPTTEILAFATSDHSFALVSQHDDRNLPCKLAKGCHKCEHCHQLDHKIDRCYVLHNRPPQSVVIVQTYSQLSSLNPTLFDTSGQPTILMNFSNDLRIVRRSCDENLESLAMVIPFEKFIENYI